jgi:Erv1 / Alr family
MCNCNKARRPAAAPSAAPAAVGRPAPSVAVTAAATPPPAITIPTVDTSVWGAALWLVLHTASVAVKDRQHVRPWRTLIDALKTGIPCPDCSAHYNAWVSRHGLRFSILRGGIREPIVRWILDLHNDVNRRTGSPSGAWSVKQVMDTYQDLAAARAALASLQGVIGDAAWAAATALLNSL